MRKVKTIGEALVRKYGSPPQRRIDRLFAKEFEGRTLEMDKNGVFLHGILVRRFFGVNFRKKRTYHISTKTSARF